MLHRPGFVYVHRCLNQSESIRFLHDDASVLHNDLKSNNVLVAQSVSTEPDPELDARVVIDFGMASFIADNKPHEDSV